MSDLEVQLERGADAFARGDLCGARVILTECAEDPRASTSQRVQALNDLAVIAAAQDRPRAVQQYLLGALDVDPGYLPALENLGTWCARDGDLVQASHWFWRATELAPEAEDARCRLEAVLRERRWNPQSALSRASVPANQARETHHSLASAHQEERVLIVVDWFFPSVGGTELLAEAVGVALQSQGLTVEIAARRLEERIHHERRGMTIHELEGDYRAELSALVRNGAYDAVLAFAGPLCWPMLATLQLPRPRPRTIVIPCVKPTDVADLHRDPEVLYALAQLVGGADVLVYCSHAGYDVRLWEDLSLPGVYVPNAVKRIEAADTPPTRAIRGGAPLLLHVANFWPEKDHLGLLRTLREDQRDWELAMIGAPSPDRPELAEQIASLAAEDPRVHLLGGATPELVAAATDEARMLLLPSLSEATPLVVLEAMSRRLPWISTPTCGATDDHAGGLILPLELFGEGIDFLLRHADAAQTLGAAGETHWDACYTWEAVGPRYAQIVRGEELSDLQAPAQALADTEEVRREFYDGRPRRAASMYLPALQK